MPTQDPIKRRDQNRDNQKRFRERQTQTIASLRDKVDRQAQEIAALRKEVHALRTENEAADATIRQLHAANSKHGELPRQFPPCVERLLAKDPHLTAANVGLGGSFLNALADLRHGSLEEIPREARFRGDGQTHALLPITGTQVTSSAHDFALDTVSSIYPQAQHSDGDLWQATIPARPHYGVPDAVTVVTSATMSPHDSLVASSIGSSAGIPFYDLSPDRSGSGTPTEDYSVDEDFTSQQRGMIEASKFTDSIVRIDETISHSWKDCENTFPANLTICPPNHRLSKYISTANMVIQQQFPGADDFLRSRTSCTDAVLAAVSWMLRRSWSTSYDCLKLMGIVDHLFSYELWRNFPNKYTYERLHPTYRPTTMQLCVPHHPAIDWLPWPQLRDKAIEHQETIDNDVLNWTALSNTVIDGVTTTLQLQPNDENVGRTTAFRVWDIYQFQKSIADGVRPRKDMAQVLAELKRLSSAEVSRLRLDPAFFHTFPQLWIPELVSEHSASALPCLQVEPLLFPAEFDAKHLESLQLAIAQSQRMEPSALQSWRQHMGAATMIK